MRAITTLDSTCDIVCSTSFLFTFQLTIIIKTSKEDIQSQAEEGGQTVETVRLNPNLFCKSCLKKIHLI